MNERHSDELRADAGGIAEIGPRSEVGTGAQQVSTDVVMTVADAVGVDPLDLEEKLHDCVDPDALEALVGSMDEGSVRFEMADRRVHVRADGTVFVERFD